MEPATQLDESALELFSERVHGPVLRPDDDGYEEAREIWNAMIDRDPAVIARCTGTADVMAAVEFADAHTNGIPPDALWREERIGIKRYERSVESSHC